MQKVLFLIHDLCEGGAERVLVNLLNNIDQSKFEITLMTLFGGGVNEKNLKQDIRLINCFKKSVPGNSHIMKLFTPKTLYRFFIKDDYDIIVSFLEGPTARIVSGCNNEDTKLVSWIHYTYHSKEELSKSFRNFEEAKSCYARFDRRVFVSRGVQKAFEEFCEITTSNEVLYNVNDTDMIIQKSKEEVDISFDDNCFNWCGVGKLVPIKGYDRMLNVQKKLIQNKFSSKLYILGNGKLEDDLKTWCKDNGIENTVVFLGYQNNPYKYVSNCDLFVCASHTEGFSTAATEALIVGTPVCSVEVSGMKELLGENNEYGIVTDNDEDALYDGIYKMLTEDGLLEHYKNQAEIRGKEFSTEKTTKAVEEMLERL